MEGTPLDIEAIVNSSPPVEWYWGIGTNSRGIIRVEMSKVFEDLLGDKWKIWENWVHFTGNPASIKDSNWKKNEVKRSIGLGEVVLKERTSFSPKEILDKKHQLEKAFKGKSLAPFEIEIYNIQEKGLDFSQT